MNARISTKNEEKGREEAKRASGDNVRLNNSIKAKKKKKKQKANKFFTFFPSNFRARSWKWITK